MIFRATIKDDRARRVPLAPTPVLLMLPGLDPRIRQRLQGLPQFRPACLTARWRGARLAMLPAIPVAAAIAL